MIKTTSDFAIAFKKARSVGTPLVAIRTADPASAKAIILSTLKKEDADQPPVLLWDCLQGLIGINKKGKEESRRLNEEQNPAVITARPAECLMRLDGIADDSIILFSNAHLFWTVEQSGGGETQIQGIWNLRNLYKSTGRMLVMLITPGAILPGELSNDVLVLDEPLPSTEDLDKIICETKQAFDNTLPDEDARRKSIDAVKGLPAFPAEQAFAFCLSKKGINYDELWERKRQVIEQTRGLSIWRGGESFDQIGGVRNVKTFLKSVINGEDAPRMAVFIDEIEKAFAGTGTDSSGVKTDMTGTMLSWMQDREADGLIFIGPPGAAKSAVAKAFGNTAQIPTIQFDFSAMQSKFVGESGDTLRKALKIVDAVSQGRSFFIATCNRITSLPPELRRRFTSGTFFFDLPTAEEREAIWKIYQAKYKTTGALPKDDGWTGAEIKECCRKSYRLRMSLTDAAQYIVPVAKSAAEQIAALRKEASGRFLSASNSGMYQFDETPLSARRSFKAAD